MNAGNSVGSKSRGWKAGYTVLLVCVAAAIPSHAQSVKTLADFNGADGYYAEYMSLVQGADGNLYGTTTYGGANNNGTVFRVTPKGKLTAIYSFCSEKLCSDGALPYSTLVQAADGNFYGTTSSGGNLHPCPNGCGTVFKITPSGKLTTLHRFENVDGATPKAGLIQARNGNFYGTTILGGNLQSCQDGCGSVFKITAAGKLTTLYNFCSQTVCSDGGYPAAALVQSARGEFYGVTSGGGNDGTVFKLTPAGNLTTLHVFNSNDGFSPRAPLLQAADGNFYGTTYAGGSGDGGTLFRITPNGTLTTLYEFCVQSGCTDGANPAGLQQATDGNLYGTTFEFGANGDGGTLFKITPKGTLTTLYSFCAQQGCSDGSQPTAALLQSTNGILYGTTSGGGDLDCHFGFGCGNVFSLIVGLGQFIETLPASGKIGAQVVVLGTNLTGATSVRFNGTLATFNVVSKSEITTTVPGGATTGTVEVTTPRRTLKSNVVFRVTK